MSEYLVNVNGQGVIQFRAYETPTDEPDLFNVGLRKITFVLAFVSINVLSYASANIWKAEGNPDRFRFGRITSSYFGQYEREIFVNYLSQRVNTGVYFAQPFFQADNIDNPGFNFSFVTSPDLRMDAISYDLFDGVQAQITLRLLKSAEFTGVWGYL